MQDDLRKPLKPRTRLQRLWERRPSPSVAAIMLAAAAFAGLAAWAALTPAPSGTEPVASAPVVPVDPVTTASTRPRTAPPPAAPEKTAEAKEPRRGQAATGDARRPPAEEEFEVLTPQGSSVPGAETLPRTPQEAERRRLAMLGLPVDRPLPRAPLKGVSERTSAGLLPRVSPSGRKPWRVYAKPVPARRLADGRPKAAIVLGGLGLNAALTRRAIRDLPGVITLAFAPHAPNLQKQINAARRAGHEVMLQVPLEPWGYPAVDPGPKTLLVSARPEQNLARLRWLMGRAAGYTGLVSYAGQKFLASGEALAPVLHEVRKRGLIFLDEGAAARSLLPSLAGVISLPAVRASVRLDGRAGASAIRGQLDRLAARAREKGQAVAVGAAFPETLDALDVWLAGRTARRELILTPLSAIVRLRQKEQAR